MNIGEKNLPGNMSLKTDVLQAKPETLSGHYDRILVVDAFPEEVRNEMDTYAKDHTSELVHRPDITTSELISVMSQFDAVIARSTHIPADGIQDPQRLKIIGRAGVGADNIPVDLARRKGIPVINSPEGSKVAVAELTTGLLLDSARHFINAAIRMKQEEWYKMPKKREDGSLERRRQVKDKDLLIIGFGNIGREVARRAQGLEMRVSAYDPFVSAEDGERLGVNMKPDLDEALSQADFITIHVPLSKNTNNLISDERIKKIKPGAAMLNLSRSNVIDTAAAARALKDHDLSYLGFDVYDNESKLSGKNPDFSEIRELLAMDNFVGTPHIGASTEESTMTVGMDVLVGIIQYLNGEIPNGGVNFRSIPEKDKKTIEPYQPVALMTAYLAQAIAGERADRIDIQYRGGLTKLDTRLLKVSVIDGLVRNITDEIVNVVNSETVAQDRNLNIAEHKLPENGTYKNSIQIRLHHGQNQTEVTATLDHHDNPRVVSINGFEVDFPLADQKHLLLVSNIDQPGMVVEVGKILKEKGINIRNMDVKEGADKQALMAILMSDALDQEQIEKIGAIPGIYGAQYIPLI